MTDIFDAKLLPCPFCGGEATIDGVKIARAFVQCVGCDVETPEYGTAKKATAAWNRRAPHGENRDD